MPLFILTETSAGYALLKAKDKKLLQNENLAKDTESAEGICSLLKLKDFQKFDSAATALEEVAALVEGKVTPRLASLLDTLKDEKKASLAVADPKLGNAINKLPQLSIVPISDATTADLYRAIRNHLPSLIPGLLPNDISTMSLGLSHSLSRHKLKFSPDKVDTMIVQAIALLDDLDKELNTYAMRVKEWYGWHFPEMGRIVNDNLAYAKIIMAMGMRTNAANSDLSDVLPEEIETAVKAAAEVSMGTEITQEDLDNIQMLADQVINFTEYRAQLSSYLSARMTAIAPNLTALVGDLVGARLIAHAGSLMNLAKSPASTIQILGAEKALFRALKTKHDTPKYGLIYHASLIGQATGKNKGKIARVLAAKAAIGIRVDALADWSAEGEGKGDDATEEEKSALGIESRLKIERRLAALEGRPIRGKGTAIAPNANNTPLQPGKWEVKEARKYNPDADGLVGDESAAAAPKQLNGKKESKKLVQQVEDDSDEQMEEVDAKDAAEEDSDEDEDESDDKPNSNGHTNGAASDVSADSPDEEIPEFKSTIVGDDKAAKKARKKELKAHEAKLEADKAAKEARRADRAQRRKAKAEKLAKKSKSSEPSVEVLAAMAGLSIERYQRKLARGEIKFENGKPVSISKKDIKKERKAAEKAASSNGDSKKRKHADEEKSEKAEKKHKKKHRAD